MLDTDQKTFNLAKAKIKNMLTMQDSMNRKVHPQWNEQNFAWHRAIWVECAEMLDHYGWKWWKHQQPDHEQVVLELVDIFHFGLSALITPEQDFDTLSEQILRQMLAASEQEPIDFKVAIEALASSALNDRSFDIHAFYGCMKLMNLSLDQLYCHYVGKNTLNFFRQDNGYKDGSYVKVWAGKEDNEHLSDIITRLDSNAHNFAEQVYTALSERYPQ